MRELTRVLWGLELLVLAAAVVIVYADILESARLLGQLDRWGAVWLAFGCGLPPFLALFPLGYLVGFGRHAVGYRVLALLAAVVLAVAAATHYPELLMRAETQADDGVSTEIVTFPLILLAVGVAVYAVLAVLSRRARRRARYEARAGADMRPPQATG